MSRTVTVILTSVFLCACGGGASAPIDAGADPAAGTAYAEDVLLGSWVCDEEGMGDSLLRFTRRDAESLALVYDGLAAAGCHKEAVVTIRSADPAAGTFSFRVHHVVPPNEVDYYFDVTVRGEDVSDWYFEPIHDIGFGAIVCTRCSAEACPAVPAGEPDCAPTFGQ